VIAVATLLVVWTEFLAMERLSMATEILADALESVPIYVWVMAAAATFAYMPLTASTIAFWLASFPLTFAAIRGYVRVVMERPFFKAAIVSGCPPRALFRQHTLPAISKPISVLLFNLAGAAIAIHGAIGAFGFSNRQTFDLGTFLLRGKELASIDPTLLILTTVAYVLAYSVLRGVARFVTWTLDYSLANLQ
jgi:ABC-type dipeptide/oligopeptide/nickel transport system permease subunit